jgi:hypothetical protein
MEIVENTGYDAYALWNALRLHFLSDYDYFKYNGKTSVSKESFAKSKTKYYFYRLARKYSIEEFKGLIIANALGGHLNYAGYLESPEGEKNLREWQKRIQALTYHFEQDIIHLFNEYELKDILAVVDDHHPRLLVELMQHKIKFETVIILDDLMNFMPMWQKKIADDVVWPKYSKIIEKYRPFLNYDRPKFRQILKEKMLEKQES